MSNNFRTDNGLTILNAGGNKIYFNAAGASLSVDPTANIAITIPVGEPAPITNDLFINISTNEIYKYDGTNWKTSGISKRVSDLLIGLRWTSKVKLVLPSTVTLAQLQGATTYGSFDVLYSSPVVLANAPYNLTAFAIGDRVIIKGNGTDSGLYQKSTGAVAGGWVKQTSSDVFALNDMFFVDWDPTDIDDLSRGATAYQVTQVSPSVDIQLIADFDFETALTVNIGTGFTPVPAGSAALPVANESVQSGLQKLSGIVRNIKDVLGITFTDVSLTNTASSFGNSAPDNSNIFTLIQNLFQRLNFRVTFAAGSVTESTQANTPAAVSSVIWEVLVVDGANSYSSTIRAVKNGTNVDYTEYGILIVGTNPVTSNVVTVSGGNLELIINKTITSTATVIRRYVD